MSYSLLINKFTAGELDPRFLGEVDYEGYRKGARKLRNVLCLPQGAGQRRFGTDYNATVGDGAAPITDIDKARVLGFNYINEINYWVVIRPNGAGGVAIDLYAQVLATGLQSLEQSITLGTYLDTDIKEIRWVRDVNRIFFFHKNYVPNILQRVAAATWTSNPAVFSFYPCEDFATLDAPLANYSNDGTTFTPNAVAATTLTASNAWFTSNHSGIAPNAGGFFIGNGGTFRIVSVNAGGTIATGYTTTPFVDTSAIKGSESKLLERAWGDGAAIGGAPAGAVRGYPRHGAFYQGRLVLGGFPASPGTAYASETKDFLNFNNSEVLPSSAFGTEAGETGSDVIQDIVATKSLVMMTAQGPSATSILVEGPTTPTNVFMNTQGEEGSRNMDTVMLNNQLIYADAGGNTMWSMVYDVPDSGYTIVNASILSSHLIRDPRWGDVYDPKTVDGRYYLLVNNDGSMAMLNSILEENIKAWTLAETTGSFIDVACMSNEAKVLVRRKVCTGAVIGGAPQDVYTVDDTGEVYRNITANVLGSGTTVMADKLDYIMIGSEIPFSKATFTLDAPTDFNFNFTYEFLNDQGQWEAFTVDSDGTNGFLNSGDIEWTIPTGWIDQIFIPAREIYDDEQVLYWIRIRRNQPNETAIVPRLTHILLNTADRIYLEGLTFGQYMDSTLVTTAAADGIIYGMDHLAGQFAYVFEEGYPTGEFLVAANGTIDIESPNANVTVGLDYKPIIVPMPVTALLKTGYVVYDPQHIKSVYVDYYKSLGMTVQGQAFPQLSAAEGITDEVPVHKTGFKLIPQYAGWDPRDEIVISQSYPAPMTIRGISFEVEIG